MHCFISTEIKRKNNWPRKLERFLLSVKWKGWKRSKSFEYNLWTQLSCSVLNKVECCSVEKKQQNMIKMLKSYPKSSSCRRSDDFGIFLGLDWILGYFVRLCRKLWLKLLPRGDKLIEKNYSINIWLIHSTSNHYNLLWISLMPERFSFEKFITQ